MQHPPFPPCYFCYGYRAFAPVMSNVDFWTISVTGIDRVLLMRCQQKSLQYACENYIHNIISTNNRNNKAGHINTSLDIKLMVICVKTKLN